MREPSTLRVYVGNARQNEVSSPAANQKTGTQRDTRNKRLDEATWGDKSDSEGDGESESRGGNQIRGSAVRTNFYPDTGGPLCKLCYWVPLSQCMSLFLICLSCLFCGRILWDVRTNRRSLRLKQCDDKSTLLIFREVNPLWIHKISTLSTVANQCALVQVQSSVENWNTL